MAKGVYDRAVKICSVEDCERKHYGNGYCQLHHRRWRTNGDPLKARPYGRQGCDVEGCDNEHHSGGYCSAHSHRATRHGDPLGGGTPRIKGRVGPYPSELTQECAICSTRGTAKTPVFMVDGVPAHKACRPIRECTAAGCSKPCHTKTLCHEHYNAIYYEANQERLRERARAWYWEDPDATRTAARRQYRNNREARRAYSRRWYWSNRMQALATWANRRAAQVEAPGLVTGEQLAARLEYFGNRCYLCGDRPNGFDHVKPLAAGGPNFASNLRPCCTSCNSTKGTTWKEN